MIDPTRGVDARRAPRHTYVNFAWFHRIDSTNEGRQEGIAHSCDVADGGLSIVTAHALPVGARLFLALVAPTAHVAAIGTVVNVREQADGLVRVGVAIEVIPPTDVGAWASMSRSDE